MGPPKTTDFGTANGTTSPSVDSIVYGGQLEEVFGTHIVSSKIELAASKAGANPFKLVGKRVLRSYNKSERLLVPHIRVAIKNHFLKLVKPPTDQRGRGFAR
jgi:hypothetical protein